MTSTSSVATTAKAKALVAKIKEFTAQEQDAPPSLTSLWMAFFRLELLQRGVLVGDIANKDDDDDDVTKILPAVQAVAGKSLVLPGDDSSPLPKPLLAGVSGMQGKLAEIMARQLRHASDDGATATAAMIQPLRLDKAVIAPIVQRCQDVRDNRCLCLLQFWNDEENAVVLIHYLWILAEGCYYRAATFAPDAPPSWKRAWETHKEQQLLQSDIRLWESRQTIPALTALGRIQKAKGNTKRAAELDVRLASAWLDTAVTCLQNSSSTSTTTTHTTLSNKMEQAFVDPFRSLPKHGAPQALDEARNLLASLAITESLVSSLSSYETYLYKILSLEWIHVQLKVGIHEAVQNVQQQAKHRSTRLTTAQVKEQAREMYHVSGEQDIENEFKVAETLLNYCFVEREKDEKDNADNMLAMKSAAMTSLAHFLANQRDCAVARQKSTHVTESLVQEQWIRLGQFTTLCFSVYSNMEDFKEKFAAFSAAERGFCREIAYLVCQVSWMTFVSHMETETTLPFSASHYEFCCTVSGTLCEEKRLVALKAKTAAVSSTSKTEELEYSKLRIAYNAAKCWMLLHQPQGSIPSSTHLEMTNEMISLLSSNDMIVEMDADLGMTFLGSLLAWSGFVRTPWEFCTVPEARSMIQKARLVRKQAKAIYKRIGHTSEAILLDLAQADAESSGLKDKALRLYQKTLDSAFVQRHNFSSALIRVRCLLGLARLTTTDKNPSKTESAAGSEESLSILQSLSPSDSSLYIWKSTGIQHTAIRSQIVLSRQTIAETLILVGRLQEAGEFLHDAVKDAPSDQVASFALGSYLLRMVFFHEQSSPEAQKVAQTQLLKAAKLDSTKPGPFALLGYWYESRGDIKRAVGCYSKALVLDPSHPVAGRGMMRLADDASKDRAFQRAIASTSSLNGWAWLAIGVTKAKIDGDSELAVSALLKATRARDIEDPMSDPLAMFYSGPINLDIPNHSDLVKGLLELSACYRRLGRCSAELRTLHTALEVSGTASSWSLLHACGQGEMELGLIEDAMDRFEKAAEIGSGSRTQASLFGKGMSAFLLGRRDLQDGKVGLALQHILDAISSCVPLTSGSSSLSKLVGDMYSFLAVFPSDLFDENFEPGASGDCLANHLCLISRGMDYYSSALETSKVYLTESDTPDSLASLVCDRAINVLLQAQLAAYWKGLSSHEYTSDATVVGLFQQAQGRFIEALRLNPLDSAAWCGFGCSLVGEPIKAQHAFSRAIELDSAAPDSYANLGFLYLENQAFDKGAEVCDILTQVADTKMTWINRAYQLEKIALDKEERDAQDIEQIADAYRAALQLQKDPFALLGLAASFRVTEAAGGGLLDGNKWENRTLLREYHSITAISPPEILGVLSFEENCSSNDVSIRNNLLRSKHDILENPGSGNAWLNLAKELLLEISGEIDMHNSQRARVAARRATALYLDNLTDASAGFGRKESVVSSDLSEALALESWLDTDINSIVGVKKAQLALLVCPQNVLAQEVLRSD